MFANLYLEITELIKYCWCWLLSKYIIWDMRKQFARCGSYKEDDLVRSFVEYTYHRPQRYNALAGEVIIAYTRMMFKYHPAYTCGALFEDFNS